MLDINILYQGPTVQLPNNATITATHSCLLPVNLDILFTASKVHVFDGIYYAYLVSLGQLCNNYCIEILDKNEISIVLNKIQFLKITVITKTSYVIFLYQDLFSIVHMLSSLEKIQKQN